MSQQARVRLRADVARDETGMSFVSQTAHDGFLVGTFQLLHTLLANRYGGA